MPVAEDRHVGYRLHRKQMEAYQFLGLYPGGERDGLPPVEEMLYGGQSGGGKLLELGTMIPTPDGFRALRDIHAGDLVLGRDGAPHLVIAESAEVVASAWRLTFDDGAEVVAHDDHQWLSFNAKELADLWFKSDERREKRRASRPSVAKGNKSAAFVASISARNALRGPSRRLPLPTGTVRTTAQLVATLRLANGRTNHAVPVASPLTLPVRQLPIDPYLLGVWLGDGSTASGEITTMDSEIVESFVAGGFPIVKVNQKPQNRAATYRFEGFRRALRDLAVLGSKHVPHDYLWASEGQRAALLAGLLDTDGNVNGSSVEFVNTKRPLTEAVAHLARSLGHKVHVREGRARLNGRDIGPKWSVKFTANRVLFRLPRKALRQGIASRQTTRFRYIIAAERTAPVAMKCLQVDTSDHLYLCGTSFIPTHNSHLARAVGVTLCSRWAGIRVPLFRRTYTELEDSHIPWIQQEIRPPVAEYNSGRHELKFANGSVLLFRHCDNEQDVYDYLTAEWGGLVIDQAEMFSPFMIRFLRHRVREPKDRYPDWRPVIFLSANPGGLSHDYLREQFVDVRIDEYGTQVFEEGQGTPIEANRVYTAPRNEGGMRRCYFPAKLEDNPSLDKDEYERRLYGLPEHLREAYLNGDWHFVPGAFFQEWMPRTIEGQPWHLWSESFARDYYGVKDDEPFPPTGWETRWTATDGGFSDPWCTLWFVRAPDKRTIVWRERYGSRVPIPAQARTILRLEQEDGRRSVERKADPAMFAKRANLTVSDADEYAKAGVRLTRGTNLREPGWRRVREALTRQIDGLPSTVFLAGRCTNLVRTLPVMMGHDNKHEDIADGQEDHACDALRYGLMPAASPDVVRRAIPIVTLRGDKVDPRLGITGVRSGW